MDSNNNLLEVRHSWSGRYATNSIASTLPDILKVGRWSVRPMQLSIDKLEVLWEMVKPFKSWFSDFTVGRSDVWFNVLMNQDALWYEICDGQTLVGLVCLEKVSRIVEFDVHFLLFDKASAEKVELVKQMIKWTFTEFSGLHRLTTEPASIYFAAIRLAQKVGFTIEGTKREALLLDGKWVNQIVMSILRREVI